MKKITIELTDEQINGLINGEEVVVLQSAFVKPKSELEIMKEKYESGGYICIFTNEHISKWVKDSNPSFIYSNNYKLIHKKHKDILDAYLKDNSVEIEVFWLNERWELDKDFINNYYEAMKYRIKPKEEYPIFKVDSEGVIIKLTSDKYEIMLDYASENIGNCFNITNQIKEYKPIPYNKERGLYHKQPVWRRYKKYASIEFWDCKENCCIPSYDVDCEPITHDQLKVMPFIWDLYKQLED